MPTSVLICDDSSLARKQMARALPRQWEVDISYATNGEEALAAIKAGQADVLFLDLTMPVMDGYEVLEHIRREDLPTVVIVVSGDVQPEAVARARSLGALEFIKKPIDPDKTLAALTQYGLL
ncbi:response regulator [Natronospirillum operosum]|uniref:Response regulator n=1 Tax=Natronospirillum operosum TaxID=2759953 RepID=A0A4Z0WA73_9GAMM|nr:response regulator [Natronospirillum operosum]TGG95529.1 response regulator [Natronospirillum operosum]